MTAQVLVPPPGPKIRARPDRRMWLLAVPVLVTFLVVLALAGAARDDAAIDAHTGYATAEVLAVTATRTVVQFTGPDGQVYSPVEGLAYPSGLQVGQLVRVEYDSEEPDQVRVEGRTWVTGVLPAAVTLVILWALVVPACWWLRSRRR
ncbi:MAG TPA: DUF3592 domain-containing protein [Pseudonocardiaceae bacterium]